MSICTHCKDEVLPMKSDELPNLFGEVIHRNYMVFE
jgi:hypothetical protein